MGKEERSERVKFDSTFERQSSANRHDSTLGSPSKSTKGSVVKSNFVND